MRHIGLFEGIGGFSLAVREMGWKTIAQSEIDPFCQEILKYHFPKSKLHGDIKTTDFKIYRGKCDILTGGFPCQDASIANKESKGLQGERTGLWKEMCRAIREIRPKYVVAENVANLLKINGGRDFGRILGEISRMGYNAEWRICTASEKGAPHRRRRLYLVAYPNSVMLQEDQTFLPYVHPKASPKPWMFNGTTVPLVRGGAWKSEPPVLVVDDGISPKLHRESIKACGNSLTPDIPLSILKSISMYELNNLSPNTKCRA